MRTYTMNTGLAAALAAPLLVACPASPTLQSYVFNPPACGPSQALSTDGIGQLICQDVPVPEGALPSCRPSVEALTADDYGTIACVPRNKLDATTQSFMNVLAAVESQLTQLQNQVASALADGPIVPASYVGLSTRAVTGRITSGAAIPGIAAAAALCSLDYGVGAHMCTPYEIYYSAARSQYLSPTADVPQGWVYLQSGKTPGGAAVPEPTAGLADNCAGYTSETAGGAGSNQWTGTTFKWIASTYDATQRVPKFFADTSCATMQPVACCR